MRAAVLDFRDVRSLPRGVRPKRTSLRCRRSASHRRSLIGQGPPSQRQNSANARQIGLYRAAVPSRLYITVNARLRALDRGARYGDPLQAALETLAPGSEITGAGSLLTPDREPLFSDIDLDITGDADAAVNLAVATLEAAGAPKGSRAQLDQRDPITFGVTEGLAIYLNGADLPAEVYATNDVNDLIAALLSSLGGEGQMQSYWEGARDTALYFYGPSAARMNELIAESLRRLPLAQGCRLVRLPLALPSRG